MFWDNKLNFLLKTKLSPAYIITHTNLDFEPIFGGWHRIQRIKCTQNQFTALIRVLNSNTNYTGVSFIYQT